MYCSLPPGNWFIDNNNEEKADHGAAFACLVTVEEVHTERQSSHTGTDVVRNSAALKTISREQVKTIELFGQNEHQPAVRCCHSLERNQVSLSVSSAVLVLKTVGINF